MELRDRETTTTTYVAPEQLTRNTNVPGDSPHHTDEPERSLVYLHFEGLDDTHHSALGRSLERLARRLWGSPALVPLGSTEFALLLDGWSAVRCQQLCKLLESAFEQGLRRLGEGVRMQLRVESVRGPKHADRQ